jgi:putative tryptophan/tyrosine transport system ATP-binding protein
VIQLLLIRDLHKVFNQNTINEKKLFNGLNLVVESGQFVTIIGSNGAGKSTLLNIISGTLANDKGSIVLNGKELSKLPEYKCSKIIGRVFQDPSKGVSSGMTILENMSMAYNKGKSFNLAPGINKKNIANFKEILSELNLGLEDKMNLKVGVLSGGQRQALSLIMAVMCKPQLLLLDEHTAALDPKTSEKILDVTDKIIKEQKITTLMVTHNLNHAIKMGNRLIMMHQGDIVIDIAGEAKRTLTSNKLLAQFENQTNKDILSDRVLFA